MAGQASLSRRRIHNTFLRFNGSSVLQLSVGWTDETMAAFSNSHSNASANR